MKSECYFSVDIESAGPIPGEFSMLSIGACVVENEDEVFYAELKPLNKNFVPKALEVSGFDLDTLYRTGREPSSAMKDFRAWVESAAGANTPVFVGFNACYDWQFVNWYLQSFTGGNPFGFGGIDIKSYFMGLSGRPWSETTSSKLPMEFQSERPQTHNALDDARAQATIFLKLRNRAESRP
jgi:DNA polymerase III epsilon subunit-like protein